MDVDATAGFRFAENFRSDAPSPAAASSMSHDGLVAARISHSDTSQGPTAIDPEETFVVSYLLTPFRHSELWLENSRVSWEPVQAGNLHVYDLAESIRADIREPVEFLYMYLPKVGLSLFAEEHSLRPLGPNPFRSGLACSDPSIGGLAALILSQIALGSSSDQLMLDEVFVQLQAQFIRRISPHGDWLGFRGGIAPWQVKRAKDLLETHITGAITVAELARDCGLSRSQLIDGFRRATGHSPHRWLTARRVERAKRLLLGPEMSLADIGLACGFAHQAHFNRVFRCRTGVSPGAWRHAHAGVAYHPTSSRQ